MLVYDELQKKLANLLIQIYYKSEDTDKGKFAFIVRKAVLAESLLALEENDVLRKTTLPRHLFKFAVTIYGKDELVSLFRNTLTSDEERFLHSLQKDPSSSLPPFFIGSLVRIIEGTEEYKGAYDLHKTAMVLLREKFKLEFNSNFGVPFEEERHIATETYSPEICAQINLDLKNALEAVALRNMTTINTSKSVTVTLVGERRTLLESGVKKATEDDESTSLLGEGKKESRCCDCCKMM